MTQDSTGTLRVLVADPHGCVREGLKALINGRPDMWVVGEAGDGPAALALAGELDPDVVVLESALPELDGAEVVVRLREARPDRKALVLTACEDGSSVRRFLAAGARGCVLKRSPADRLMQALRAVADGDTYLDPELAGAVAGDLFAPAAADAELSTREADVVRRIAQGYSNKEIAARLKVSVKTVETYKARALEKLQTRSRVDVVRYAVRRGWLTADAPEPLVASGVGRPQ